jgi:hypothetical protein
MAVLLLICACKNLNLTKRGRRIETEDTEFFRSVAGYILYEHNINQQLRFIFHGVTPLVGQDLLIIKAPRSQSDTAHSEGLLWTSDQPVADTSTGQHTTDRHTCPRRDLNQQSQQDIVHRPTPLDRAATGFDP